MIELTEHATEGGTYIISAVFTDEDGASVIPTFIKWDLTDQRGNIINSRDDVIVIPAASIDILLQGNDLAIVDNMSEVRRILTVFAKYNSSLGSDLPLDDSAHFFIDKLAAKRV